MELKKSTTAGDLIDFLQLDSVALLGDASTQIQSFELPGSDKPESFAFINQEKWIETAETSAVACILAPTKFRAQISEKGSKKTWIFCDNVEFAAQKIKTNFVFATPYRPSTLTGIHPTAVVAPTARIAASAVVGPLAVIGENCVIEDNCFIGSHCVLEENVVIAEGSTLHPHVYIGHSCLVGRFCEIKPQAVIGSEGYGYAHDAKGHHHRIPHTGRVILKDYVHVGALSTIDRGTLDDSIIGENTKIDNLCHFAHNSIIGKNGLLTAGAIMAGSSTLGDNFICGGQTGITGHIQVTDNVNVAARSGITSSIAKPGAYGGFPVIPLKDHLKSATSLAHLPTLRKQVNRILRHLFPEEFQ